MSHVTEGSVSLELASAEQTEAAGAVLARVIQQLSPDKLCICLEGELGAGKTTFARGMLRGFGHAGRVPSPTYTLVEPYDVECYQIYHLDLYRLHDGAELEYLGISEMTESGSVLLIEWPSRAADTLPAKDLEVVLKVSSEGRLLSILPSGELGANLLAAFAYDAAALKA
ncbi:MAG: tRNA (adenosine(37)-N6)-threonylcarbamoyltransferase complex ATPase subunit type 1 TsaE [Gammaproteobacteria bacterium]|nr:tRNA (adenosine(37)-N6)-threonylcarbamoyltransferase complex ATPase subunit type 1 TsaE [Gammaproteobacteria bacterium]MCP4091111.1 tRNA (adenosine(37)-N6)-threonylcarbamoyltransferase complex ATPase subunit type 1 TsaE [Gammaproteobacteria bacterium]MCP4277363.1 tRNA (adenosine(37)-N6)-threonylcarbamoyltransferase complex ATPase subunit type 1 TsaE [Gammaproteobacteria bacterium]MCP4831576.1 tRNA (adenosine(37)-N6)-threonylcarbamoyltransferase complex ATPase subunit type 1 TsaE [Gammaproteob